MENAVEVKRENDLSLYDELNSFVKETDSLKSLCKKLMETPHYSKLKEDGIFAVVHMARELGMSVRVALNGALGYDRGKVTMPAQTMNAMIRGKGHSITKDPVSDLNRCVLIGKRADNGDTIRVSYTIEEATKAGLTSKDNWKNHQQAMLFARALSMLARQLFSDVICGLYVKEEMSEEIIDLDAQAVLIEEAKLSAGQIEEFEKFAAELPATAQRILNMWNALRIDEVHPNNWDFVNKWMVKEREKQKADLFKAASEGE